MVGAVFGCVHDAVTFQLSPEYYRLLKFEQFAWSNMARLEPGLAYACQIGGIAGGVAGGLGAWLLGRWLLGRRPLNASLDTEMRCSLIVLLFGASAGAFLAFLIASAVVIGPFFSLADDLGLTGPAVHDFARVATIHWGAYLGFGIALACRLLATSQLVRWLLQSQILAKQSE